MKTIKTILSLVLMLSFTALSAQLTDKGMKKTTTIKKFNVQKDGHTIPYKVTIYKKSIADRMVDPKDVGKEEQNRINLANDVTKLIYIDAEMDNNYDKFIVLRYTEDKNDSFELVPTAKGFKVVVDGKYAEYILGEGFYFVNNKDRDYFIVNEFDSI